MKTFFYNVSIYPLGALQGPYKAALVEDGKILELFMDNKQVPGSQAVDCEGACMIPSFTDCHTHSFEGGFYALCADLSNAGSVSDALDVLKTAGIIDGRVIGWNYRPDKVSENRFPSIEELDKICPDIPLMLRRKDGHSCMINSAAMKKIFRKKMSVSDKLGFAGKLNHKISLFFHDNMSDLTVIEAYKQTEKLALASGHGRVHTMIGDGRKDPEHYLTLKEKLDEFSMDFDLYPQIVNPAMALALGSNRIGGCILVDGSFGSHTAALNCEYDDLPGVNGKLDHSSSFWTRLFAKAEKLGLDVCAHAIGDRAIEQYILAALKAGAGKGSGRRHQIIHCELFPDNLIAPMEKAGLIAVMQPAFDAIWNGPQGLYAKSLGRRANITNRFKTFLDHSIPIAGSSDWYITPLDALGGIKAAQNHNNPAERISRLEAVKMYTEYAAYAGRHEKDEGSLAPGYKADFVLLSEDIFMAADLDSISAKAVYKSGKRVF